jgi:hypothetical protein
MELRKHMPFRFCLTCIVCEVTVVDIDEPDLPTNEEMSRIVPAISASMHAHDDAHGESCRYVRVA